MTFVVQKPPITGILLLTEGCRVQQPICLSSQNIELILVIGRKAVLQTLCLGMDHSQYSYHFVSYAPQKAESFLFRSLQQSIFGRSERMLAMRARSR